MTGRAREEGAALLSVLLFVAVMGALAAASFDRLKLATSLEANAAGLEQARAFALAAETMAAARIEDLLAANPAKTTLAGGWDGRETRLPLPVGEARLRVSDGGNCFNLNSVVMGEPGGTLVARPRGVEQFVALMVGLGALEGDARRVATALADWIDSDSWPLPGGVEDEAYETAPKPYLAANAILAEASELRVVSGVTPELYARLRPWVCALPTTELSPINVNTLSPSEAPLVAMLLPGGLRADQAQAMIEGRPTAGWDDLALFWRLPALAGLVPPGDVLTQPKLTTRWFEVDLRVAVGGAELHQTALVDARTAPARVVARRWTADE